ncbi:MAG: hypothetical protein LBS95_02075 [Mycoplasmataceae bacterium]|jgi:hypothetical protein|nr:hypothetical protein [Mycoplasmataceae bacterium]
MNEYKVRMIKRIDKDNYIVEAEKIKRTNGKNPIHKTNKKNKVTISDVYSLTLQVVKRLDILDERINNLVIKNNLKE